MYKRKTITFILFMLTSHILFAGFTKTTEVFVEPNKIHVPMGFDSNDNVELIVTGELSTCHKQPFGEVKIIDKQVIVYLKSIRTLNENIECAQAIMRYLIAIPLGQLKAGDYAVTINPGQKTEKASTLNIISPRSNNIDDFTYANVTRLAKIKNKAILIKGLHPSSCIEIDRVETIQNEIGDTIAVLPIVKQTSFPCDRTVKPFAYELTVPSNLETTVFHVRTKDGRAINLTW